MVSVWLRHGPPRFYKWRAKYGGMQVSEGKRLKELEDENRQLKKMYRTGGPAELSLQNEIIKEALAKSDGLPLR